MASPLILPVNPVQAAGAPAATGALSGVAADQPADNIFDKMLGRAIDALNNVSATEMNANRLIDEYVAGRAELSDVMVATSKMTLAVTLAVTTITSAVNSFKEITQMPI